MFITNANTFVRKLRIVAITKVLLKLVIMKDTKLTPAEIQAWEKMQFVRGLKKRVKDACISAGRVTTTWDLIRFAFNPMIPDTPIQQQVREIAVKVCEQQPEPQELETA